MKVLVFIGLMVLFAGIAGAEWVNGYSRSSGTYVSGYYRTDRNSYTFDNYSYRPERMPKSYWSWEK